VPDDAIGAVDSDERCNDAALCSQQFDQTRFLIAAETISIDLIDRGVICICFRPYQHARILLGKIPRQGENRRIANITATNSPAAAPNANAPPNARFHAADRLLVHENTIEASRPNAPAATAPITMLVNI
jgi:hypothetical protein